MTRSINKSNFLALSSFNCESSNGLSDEAEFFLGQRLLIVSKGIQKRSLSMIDVSHYGNDRCSLLVLTIIYVEELNVLLIFETHNLDCILRQYLEFIGNDFVCLLLDNFDNL